MRTDHKSSRAITSMLTYPATCIVAGFLSLHVAAQNAPGPAPNSSSVALASGSTNEHCRALIFERGQNRPALDYARQWVKTAGDAANVSPSAKAAAQTCLALALACMGDAREAEAVAKAVDVKLLTPTAPGDWHLANALTATSIGRPKRSLDEYKLATSTYAKAGLNDYASAAMNGEAVVLHHDMEEEKDAIERLDASKLLCKSEWCRADHALTRAGFETQTESALVAHQKVLVQFEKIGDFHAIAQVNLALADLHANSQEWPKAETALATAEKYNATVNARATEAAIMIRRADVFRARGDAKKAKALYETAIPLARDIGANQLAKNALTGLNELE
jgi:tetratricopeptide (TPR) repeat protein